MQKTDTPAPAPAMKYCANGFVRWNNARLKMPIALKRFGKPPVTTILAKGKAMD